MHHTPADAAAPSDAPTSSNTLSVTTAASDTSNASSTSSTPNTNTNSSTSPDESTATPISQLSLSLQAPRAAPFIVDSNFEYEYKFPSKRTRIWEEFKQAYPEIAYPQRRFTGYNDALSAACVTLQTANTNHIVENFNNRLASYCMYRLQQLVPELTTSQVKAICWDYVVPVITDGDIVWSTRSVSSVSVRAVDAAITVLEELKAHINRPCGPVELSSPGSYIPVLRSILETFTLAHKEAEAALGLMQLAGMESDEKEQSTVLPRLFFASTASIVQLVVCHYQHNTDNQSDDKYEQNLDLFN
ncbi:hypothetical protein DFQ28_005981 [Apophysomyces sp. BC1034]|nr:hypothetical protein DFQ28_005981 [Apophysomyces sp. BC1034]